MIQYMVVHVSLCTEDCREVQIHLKQSSRHGTCLKRPPEEWGRDEEIAIKIIWGNVVMGYHSSDLSFHQAMLINYLGVCFLLDYFKNLYGTGLMFLYMIDVMH